MFLLIPHYRHAMTTEAQGLGDMPGEVESKILTFREQATKFWLALRVRKLSAGKRELSMQEIFSLLHLIELHAQNSSLLH